MEPKNRETNDIKTMKLYSHVDRIYNELRELGYDMKDETIPLKVEDVSQVDQYHYHGTAAVDLAINNLGIVSSSKVLDIGSGLGGPARYLVHKTKCHVTAVELQQDLHTTAQDLTTRCRLSDHIKHICGDFLNMDLGQIPPQDVIVSWLVFLHIQERFKLFQRCLSCLKPGGKLYAEDFFLLAPMTTEESNLLENDVFCKNLPTKDQYIQQLETAGFTNIQFEDVTGSWTKFVHNRLDTYKAKKDRHIRVHNEMVYQEQEHFYSSVDKLFAGGHVGGCKVKASKSSE